MANKNEADVGKVGIKELVDQVADGLNDKSLTKKSVDAIVRQTLNVISDNLEKHREVGFTGQFTLIPKLRAARTGRNPQDPTKSIAIPEQWTVTLKLGKILKESIQVTKKKK